MVIGSIVFAISAVLLLIDPSGFLTYIGVPSDESVIWSFKLMGLVLIALAIHMATRREMQPTLRFVGPHLQ